ncbi:MAG: M1 family metallopeptidase [Saprospiraceae bacterium]|nr:M1 family metallopeptidase [Saprospiraceae bacterium]
MMCSNLSAQNDRWQINVKYDMDVELNDETHLLKGSQDLIFYNNSPDTIYHLWYHLYLNAFQPGSDMDVRSRFLPDPDSRIGEKISKLKSDEIGYQKILAVSQSSKPLKFYIEGTIMKLDLESPVFPGDSTVIQMQFESQIPVQIRRTGRSNKEGIAYSMSQWYPKLCNYDEHGWHTDPYIAREFYAPWAYFDVKIKLASDYCIAATGYLQNPKECNCNTKSSNQNKYKTWHFITPQVHDFVWAADKEFVHDSFLMKDNRLLFFYYRKEQAYSPTWKLLPPVMDRALDIIEELVGTYPYDSYSFIQGGDGGMEYPMATLITGNRPLVSLVGVAVHEWLHSWFQMLLASNEALYPWMDEGFTAYIEEEVMNRLKKEGWIPGSEPAEDPHAETLANFKTFAGSPKEEPLSTHADHFSTNRAYGVGSYVKGALCLHQLRYIMGEKPFWTGLQAYFENWKFKHPNPDDFFRTMEKNSNLELDWFKQYWVGTTKTIDYSISSVTNLNGQTLIELERIGLFPMPVDIALILEDSSVLMCHIPLDLMRGHKNFDNQHVLILNPWHWVQTKYKFEIPVDFTKLKYVVMDTLRMMADLKEENDYWEAEPK